MAETNKRMKVAFDGSMMRIACDDGSTMVIDTINGEAYKLRDNKLVSKPLFCPHTNTEPYLRDQAGGDVDICLDCGEFVDPTEQSWEDVKEVEF